MKLFEYPYKKSWSEICKRPLIEADSLEKNVSEILRQVKLEGDEAIKKLTAQFDKVSLGEFEVSEQELQAAIAQVSDEVKNAIQDAAKNIRLFHESQKNTETKVAVREGITCWRKSIPIESVGLYIPGGSAPLFSTVLMLGIPAQIAGCKEVILCSPADKQGKLHPAILYAAQIVGVHKIFKIGGAQAVAAMAYGTTSVPKVYKIFGPGNQYVTCAKQLLAKEGVAIDMPAGPSEVAILADESCEPSYVAADLLSQAEHGADSQVLLVSTSKQVIDKVNEEINNQLMTLPRKEVAEKAISNSRAILVSDLNTGMELMNFYAPEHLILCCNNPELLSDKVVNAGSVFIGNYSCESAGDYASGTNHTLPTNGYAKAFSGVSLDSFYKKITFQQLTREGLEGIAKTITVMAEEEGLMAHSNAVKIRMQKK